MFRALKFKVDHVTWACPICHR